MTEETLVLIVNGTLHSLRMMKNYVQTCEPTLYSFLNLFIHN